MLKNTDKYEDTTHFSYEDYNKKKKAKASNNRDLMIFVSVFMVGVLIILGFAKILSPNVDVAISVNDENAVVAEDEDTAGTSIVDDRLRKLKMEDEGKKEGEEEMFSPELDERVILPKQRRKTVGEMEAEKNKVEENKVTEQHLNEVQDSVNHTAKDTAKPSSAAPKTPVVTPSVNAKVVVGYYATEKQADVAKSIIQDAGLGVTPIVKNMGGYYTLQVGSYSSREKAQQFANSLLKSNFPARVVVE